MNTTINTPGRFGNQFIRNMACHFIAHKYNLRFTYSVYDTMKQFGIVLFTEGANIPSNNKHTFILNDTNFYNVITKSDISSNLSNCNIKLYNTFYAQTGKFALYLRSYFNNIKDTIIKSNKFTTRYSNNNDVFVHVRLGDIANTAMKCSYIYYDKVLSSIQFTTGYITSDSINHPICQKLIEKYKLQVYRGNEVDTIMFGNTCKYIVLSGGTFSWLIGLFGFNSSIYYPKQKQLYYGDIFVFPDWNGIEC